MFEYSYVATMRLNFMVKYLHIVINCIEAIKNINETNKYYVR